MLPAYRVRLANARVSVNTSQNQDSEEAQRDVIPLLCSIFLASQGAGETAEAISPVILSSTFHMLQQLYSHLFQTFFFACLANGN
jgi:hypothetical protein